MNGAAFPNKPKAANMALPVFAVAGTGTGFIPVSLADR